MHHITRHDCLRWTCHIW